MIAACRQAGIAPKHDAMRLSAVGLAVSVLGKDPSDNTVKCNAPSVGNMWFPINALKGVPRPPKQTKTKNKISWEGDGAQAGPAGDDVHVLTAAEVQQFVASSSSSSSHSSSFSREA